MGRSPLEMRQVTETESSTFVGSSPKVKGVILGGAWEFKVHSNYKITELNMK